MECHVGSSSLPRKRAQETLGVCPRQAQSKALKRESASTLFRENEDRCLRRVRPKSATVPRSETWGEECAVVSRRRDVMPGLAQGNKQELVSTGSMPGAGAGFVESEEDVRLVWRMCAGEEPVHVVPACWGDGGWAGRVPETTEGTVSRASAEARGAAAAERPASGHLSAVTSATDPAASAREELAGFPRSRETHLEGVARQLAHELDTTRAQLTAAVRLALGLSHQLDQHKLLLSQQLLIHQQQEQLKQQGNMGLRSVLAQAGEASARVEGALDANSCVEGVHQREGCQVPCESQGSGHGCEGDVSASSADSYSEDTDRIATALMEQESRLCRVCHEASATTVTLPCRHLVLCKRCSAGAEECPKCLVSVQGVLHTSN